jgi:3-deoxy-D-manno-octulosonate 8-phosphate phosphatase (KDO 8-P phosphatase)
VYQKAINKLDAFSEIAMRKCLSDSEICVVGDDLPDLPILRRAGLSVAVPDAVDDVRLLADCTTRHAGGSGAVREICEIIMKAQGTWQTVTARYY